MQGNPLVLFTGYDPALGAVSILLAIAATYVTLELVSRLRRAERPRPGWLAAGGCTFGLGLWAMQLMATLALRLPLSVRLDMRQSMAALALGVLGATGALALIWRGRASWRRVLGTGLLLGLVTTGMNFLGLAGLRMAAIATYEPLMAGLAVGVTLIAATGTMWLVAADGNAWPRKLASALAIGAAMAGAHFTAASAVQFTPSDISLSPLTATLDVAQLDAVLIGLSTLFVLAIGLLAALQEYQQRRAALAQAAAAEELALANQRLRAADRYKDEFLSVISHELRTPLNFITGFASILDDELEGPLNARQKQHVERILNGSDRMLRLVNDLLDLAKLQAGKFQLDPGPVSYPLLVEEAVASLTPLAQAKGVSLSAKVNVPDELTADGQRVVQVIINLLSNAIKFTPTGGRVTLEAFFREGDAPEVVTQVTDTGCGIKPEDIPKLFTRFQQLDMSATRQQGGTGLGLSICKGLVEAHGGQVGVLGEPGVGSTFWFTLPAGHAVYRASDASLAPPAGKV